ncbi:MAG: enoyl-CoA hydratase/isomerase family protein [Haloferacaceae archaeon]
MVDFEAYESLSVDVNDSVATIEFHRPDSLNAISTQVLLDLQRAFDEIQLDRSVDAVVIQGEGDEAFSAGADIEQYAGTAEENDPRQKDRQELFYDVFRKARNVHPVTIAKIHGYCVGGGLVLATYCDVRIATADATFGIPTCDIGQIPGGGATSRTVQLVGEAKAKELVLTAGFVGGEEAHRIGLVNRLVDDHEALDTAVDELVDAVGDTGRRAVKNSKRALNRAADAATPDEAREYERDLWWEQFATDERRQLVDGFVDED